MPSWPPARARWSPRPGRWTTARPHDSCGSSTPPFWTARRHRQPYALSSRPGPEPGAIPGYGPASASTSAERSRQPCAGRPTFRPFSSFFLTKGLHRETSHLRCRSGGRGAKRRFGSLGERAGRYPRMEIPNFDKNLSLLFHGGGHSTLARWEILIRRLQTLFA